MPRALDKRVLNELFVRKVSPGPKPFLVWDALAPGLCLRIRPSGQRTFKFAYRYNRRLRWFNIGLVPLAEARKVAVRLRSEVLVGRRDPQAEKQAEKLAQRNTGTFGELCERYLERHAKRQNRSWAQGARLIHKYVMPQFSRLDAKGISRSDVRQLIAGIESPSVANVTLAAVSAVFTWATKMEILDVNPARGIERHKMRSRERVLGDGEIPKFWNAFTNAGEAGIALKVLLMTAQRPGEIVAMRYEHVAGNWWTLPGDPVPALGWPGTKNGEPNRIFLSAPVRELISAGEAEGAVFAKGLRLPAAMRKICEDLGVERAIPHDLRRTCTTLLARLRVGGDVADRILNHKDRTVRSTYDRYDRDVEIKRAMERVAALILQLAEGRPEGVVVGLFN